MSAVIPYDLCEAVLMTLPKRPDPGDLARVDSLCGARRGCGLLRHSLDRATHRLARSIGQARGRIAVLTRTASDPVQTPR